MFSALLALAVAAPLKVAVMPLAAGEGLEERTVKSITEAAVAEIRRRPEVKVVTPEEIAALLSLEKQKAAFGCQNDACFAEIGGALGVDRMVTGDLALLGKSWMVHLKLIDVAKVQVLVQADRRIKGGTIDDVLDALPGLAQELFPGGQSTPVPMVQAEASASAPVAGGDGRSGERPSGPGPSLDPEGGAPVPPGRPPPIGAGRPEIRARAEAYWVWHDAGGWHLRATAASAPRRFSGVVAPVRGRVVEVRPTRADWRAQVRAGERAVRFDFAGRGEPEGFDWQVTSECIFFDLKVDGSPRADLVYLGGGDRPLRMPFFRCEEGGGQRRPIQRFRGR